MSKKVPALKICALTQKASICNDCPARKRCRIYIDWQKETNQEMPAPPPRSFPELMKELKRVCLLLADAHAQAETAFEALGKHPDVQEFLEQQEEKRKEVKAPCVCTYGGMVSFDWAIAVLKYNAKDYKTQAEELYGNPDITFEEYMALVDKYTQKMDKLL